MGIARNSSIEVRRSTVTRSEIVEETPKSRLEFSGAPHFSDFKPEYVTPAVEALLAENRAVIDELVSENAPPTWDTFVQPLEEANERFAKAWGIVSHLNAVMNSVELRETYKTNLPKVTQYYTELSQHEGLFAKFKALRTGAEFARLTGAQRKVVENELRDFRLGGAELSREKKARLMAIREKLSEVSLRFSDNLLDATDAWSHCTTDGGKVAGLPEDVLQAAQEAAEAEGKAGWKFTLHAPSYLPVMQYADSRSLRELMYRAYVTRASEFGKEEWDNTPLIAEILRLRQEEAKLLGFENYAELSLERKMAKSPRQVLDFLAELAVRARPYAQRDLDELQQFSKQHLGLDKLEGWDISYASEKLRISRYSFSDQEVKQYLPETRVLAGMFKLVHTLYGISIKHGKASTWHNDARFFDVRDRNGALIGRCYLDLYARKDKQDGGWTHGVAQRFRTIDGLHTPLVFMICNFSAPIGGRPALFTHEEVITLLHEFGHGLHHLLTRVDVLGASGTSGVEWDAIELPSQLMENFCWEWEVLATMTGHIDTGVQLPRSLFDKMLAAKNFMIGMQTIRQIENALFDMRLHYDFDPHSSKSALQLLEEIREQVAVLVPPAFHRLPNAFSHIFDGGYAAGYYSYKWAEVLSADAYSLFEENGVLDPRTGGRFRDEILAVGGSRPALESFIAFRGREPKMDALLRHSGMSEA